MNFLAHSLFGFDDDGILAGQFCGDFVRGTDLSRFPVSVRHGIRLHRHLDRYTDQHPALLAVRSHMTNVPRRVSGIVLDVLFDHFLARHWSRYSALTLDDHAKAVIKALERHQSTLPPGLQQFTRLLSERRILQNNVYLRSVSGTLHRLADRSTRLQSLALTEAQLQPLRPVTDSAFVVFYPDLQTRAIEFKHQLQAEDQERGF